MPLRRQGRDETECVAEAREKEPTPEWREPPGRLGDYVRRVKAQRQGPHRRS